MREGIPADDFLNAFDHEVAHYSTVNFGKSDNEFIKWLNRENPSVMEKVMNYNVNSVPYRPESDVSKIRTARGLSPTTKNLNYYRNEQELRSNAYSMLQEAKRRGISTDELVDMYTVEDELMGEAPKGLLELSRVYTPENLKKYLKGFLSVATPVTLGLNAYKNE